MVCSPRTVVVSVPCNGDKYKGIPCVESSLAGSVLLISGYSMCVTRPDAKAKEWAVARTKMCAKRIGMDEH